MRYTIHAIRMFGCTCIVRVTVHKACGTCDVYIDHFYQLKISNAIHSCAIKSICWSSRPSKFKMNKFSGLVDSSIYNKMICSNCIPPKMVVPMWDCYQNNSQFTISLQKTWMLSWWQYTHMTIWLIFGFKS